jgi:hypothetical protein
MSQELHYTSVPRGLKPGSRGFGTVAATASLPETLANRLEALSVYEAVYPPGDPSAALNPIAYVHVRLKGGDQDQDVLSRIGPAGLDYSGRPNKYAHHVILRPEERPEGGPAWLISQPGFLHHTWEGEPRMLAEGPSVPRGDRPSAIAEAWHAQTGDAGWAGVLAEAFLADPRRPVFLVYRPGIELLPLFVEAIALLPPSRRWDVEFSTYLTTLPPGVSYTWRGVLEGSAQAKGARRLPNALIVDLCRSIGRAPGGPLVHLARTGERLEIPDAAPALARHESNRPPHITAGPPPRPTTSGRGSGPDAPADRDWLPDLAARLAEDESLLGGDKLRHRKRPRAMVAITIAACLVPMLALAFYLSPAVRHALGLEPARKVDRDRQIARPASGSEPPSVNKGAAEKPAEPVAAKKESAKAEVAKADVAKPEAPPAETKKPETPAARMPAPPLLLAFATPEVPRSSLGSPARQGRTIELPEDADDRMAILNGPEFRLTAVPAAPHTWEIATKTGSGLGGGFSLARLNRADGRTWQFEWTKNAKTQSTQVEGLKDAILELHGRDGRPIRVLLRDVELRSDPPLAVWKDEKILFEKLDLRVRSVGWGGKLDVLDGTHWKPLIRRWRAVLSRPRSDPGDVETPRRVFEPAPVEGKKDPGAGPALECDLIPEEVTLKLAIDPSRAGSIDVRIEPDRERILEGRALRAARLDELRKDTPKDKNGDERNPLEFRRARLRKLRDDGAREKGEIKGLEREIAELEKIEEIRRTEDLLTRPARLELSVVIGLDVEGPGILDIVRIGEFAAGR